MQVRNALAAAVSCILFMASATEPTAAEETKAKLDANGVPCNGELDGALQCMSAEATKNTPDRPYRRAGHSDGRLAGPGRGFGLGAKHLIYAAVPGSVIVFDAKKNYEFVKRITFQ